VLKEEVSHPYRTPHKSSRLELENKSLYVEKEFLSFENFWSAVSHEKLVAAQRVRSYNFYKNPKVRPNYRVHKRA
jgi:hypothetical protein